MNQRREIAELISQGKIDSAMIRVEHVIRDDYFQEALEMLSLYVDTLLARFGLLSHKQLDAGISEPVYAIVFAAPRVNIKELEDIKHQFQHKYGRELIDNANNNPDIFVNPKLFHKLSIIRPDRALIELYLTEISRHFKVDYQPVRKAAPNLTLEFIEPNYVTSREITENNTNLVNNESSVVQQVVQPPFAQQFDKSQLPIPPVTSREAAVDNLQQNKPRSMGQVPSMPSVPKEIFNQLLPDKQEPDFDALAKRFDSLRKR